MTSDSPTLKYFAGEAFTSRNVSDNPEFPVALIIEDIVRDSVFVNRAAQALLGITASGSWSDFFKPLLTAADYERFLMNKHALLHYNLPYTEQDIPISHPDSSIGWIQIHSEYMRTTKTDDCCLVHVFTDITKYKVKEIQLLGSLEEFREMKIVRDKINAIIAHDLRAPFQGLLFITESLAHDLESISIAKIKEMASLLFNLTSTTLQELNDLLIWAKAQSGLLQTSPQLTPVIDLIKKAIAPLVCNSKAHNINFSLHLVPNLTIYGDRQMVILLYRNIISNALQHSPDDSTISIFGSAESAYTRIDILDEGPGLSTGDLDIFNGAMPELHSSAMNSSFIKGLGLPVSKELAKLNNGKITAQNTSPLGAKISISLPSSPPVN